MPQDAQSPSRSYSGDERRRLISRVEQSLEHIRPALRADGGDAEIVDITEEGRLILRLVGTCGECPMSPQTLKQGIERVIHRDVPEIREISTHYVYFILLTSHRGPDYIVTGLSAGADDLIVKPFNPEELLLRVHTGERIVSLESRDMVVFAMAQLAESRDRETGKHLERVRKYAQLLARRLMSVP